MTELIGTLDERTLHSEIELRDLRPLANVYWEMTARNVHPSQFASRFGEEKGTVQVYYPGPVAVYERVNGNVMVRIYHNGNPKQSEELHRRLLPHQKKSDT